MEDDGPENATRVTDEVGALRAIYGVENVSHLARTGALSVDLGDDVGVLSMRLPSGYPSCERPLAPTLRSNSLAASACAQIVEDSLGEVHDGITGAECVFQYCQAVSQIVRNSSEKAETEIRPKSCTSGDQGSSAAAEGLDFAREVPVFHGEPLVDKKSAFQAHVAYISDVVQVGDFREYLQSYGKVASAAHNVLAYKVGPAQDFDDDGEHGAGKGLLFILQHMNCDNTVVVVSRWFGGIKLGPVRFKHINNVARSLLTERPRPVARSWNFCPSAIRSDPALDNTS
jgi:Uncharacterized protein family UPF0029